MSCNQEGVQVGATPTQRHRARGENTGKQEALPNPNDSSFLTLLVLQLENFLVTPTLSLQQPATDAEGSLSLKSCLLFFT